MAGADTDYKLIDRKLGLLGGTVLLVGTVIGISVFFLPGVLIADAGPSIVLALAITAVPMAFSVLSLLQLGGAMPVAGGSYVYGSRLVSPFWGFLSVWLVVPAIWATLLFTSLGFAEFVRYFVDLPAGVLATGVLLAFLVLNLRGLTLVAWVQLVMVGVILLSILSFVLPGIGSVDVTNYTPLFPLGVAPALIAVVSLYIPFQGFSMIVELGEELRDPVRNIPRVLLYGMGVAVVLSLGLVVVFVGLDDWETLAGFVDGGIAQAASTYLPTWVGVAVATGAVLGALTTINAVLTSYSRTLMRASRDHVLSPRFARVSEGAQVPYWAVLALGLPPILVVGFSPGVVLLTVFLALVILLGNFVGSIALWNLPKRFPAAYEHSIYKLPMGLLKTSAIVSATFAVLFWLAVVTAAPLVVVVLLGLIALGYIYYRFRIRQLAWRGMDLRAALRQLPDHEATMAGTPTQAGRDVGPDEDPAPRPPRRIRVLTPPPSQRVGADGAVPPGATDVTIVDLTDAEGPRCPLSAVPGLGDARRGALLDRFGTVDEVAAASREQLLTVPGIGPKLATKIERTLEDQTPSSTG